MAGTGQQSQGTKNADATAWHKDRRSTPGRRAIRPDSSAVCGVACSADRAHIPSMATVRDDTWEARRRGVWTPISIEEALDRHADKVLRCPACHGRIRAHRASADGMPPHFEHYTAHPGCPRDDSYSGAPAPHPEAI